MIRKILDLGAVAVTLNCGEADDPDVRELIGIQEEFKGY